MYRGRAKPVLASHSDSYSKLDSISVSASEPSSSSTLDRVLGTSAILLCVQVTRRHCSMKLLHENLTTMFTQDFMSRVQLFFLTKEWCCSQLGMMRE